jgi:ubiquitin conjugation factor E4 B
VDLEFLAEVVKLFEEQDDLKPTIITTVEQMSQELSAKTMNDDYKPYVTVRFSLQSHISCAKCLLGTEEPRT